MPDTVTPNFDLIKPEIDGSPDTWGDKWHDAIDKIDAAMAKIGGINANMYEYNNAGIEPPDTGEIRLNNANPSLATKIWISFTTFNSVNAASYLQKAIVPGSYIYVQNFDNPANWAHYQVSTIMTNEGTYGEWDVLFVSQGSSLANGRVFLNSISGGSSFMAALGPDLWFGAIAGAPNRWSWNDKADATGNEVAALTETGDLQIDGAFTSGGALTTGGNITSAARFISTATALIIGAGINVNSNGSVTIRPNGQNDADGQLVISTSGAVTADGPITSVQNFLSSTANLVLAPSAAGTIFLRPDGSGSVVGQVTIDDADGVTVRGSLGIDDAVHTSRGVKLGRGFLEKNGVTDAYGTNWMNVLFVAAGDTRVYADATQVGAIPAPSDYRLKQFVSPLENAWDHVMRMRPVSYQWKDYGGIKADGVTRWGFLAHELQEALIPSAASGSKDMEGGVQVPDAWTLIAALTSALQEAMIRIERLERAA